MATARINGIDLYYEVHGEGPPLVLAHGVGSNHLHWWQQIPALQKRFTVVTFDHRGFGFSTEDGQGPQAFADDLAALIDHLGFDSVFLAGQSMGGVTAMSYAARFPQRVRALALSCSGGGVVPVHHAPTMKGALEKSLDYLSFARLSIDQDDFRRRRPEACFLFEQLGQLNRDVDLRILTGMRQLKNDLGPLVAAGTPVLLIGGEDDNGVNPSMRELQKMIPGARFELVTDAGHLLFFERPDVYNHLLESFFCQHMKQDM